MKTILVVLIALFITNEVNSQVQRDTLKPVKLEKGKELLLDSTQLSHLLLYFAFDEQRRVIPEIQMYAFYKPYGNILDQKGYRLYFLYDNLAYSFSDTLIISGLEDGESGSTLLTIWKKAGDKYRFISVLDKSLATDAHVDSVFNLGRNKYLLAGLTEWGDAGDGAGSIWFAVWELPGSFKMIYYDKWFVANNDNKQYSYNYTFDNELLQISLEKLVVHYKNSGSFVSNKHTDWKASKSIINVNLSSKTDLTSDFNNYSD